MRRIEALELKRTLAQLDHINQIFTPSCYNCHSPTHELEDCPLLPNALADSQDQLNATFHHQRNDPYAPTYNPGWRDHPNFFWNHGTYQKGPLSNENQLNSGQISRPNVGLNQNQPAFVNPHSTQSSPSQLFANPIIPPPGLGNEQEHKLSNMEKTFISFMQSTTQMLNANQQTINRLELKVSQMASQINEREKETFPNQSVVNPMSTSSSSGQVNAVHTLRSGKKIDNQVVMPDQASPSFPKVVPSYSGSDELKEKENKIVSEPLYEPPAPFPNRLKPKKHPAQVEKALEIFKQVKVNIPLLDVIEQVPSYAKFLKDLCTKKRATQVPKKVFLAANISEILSNSIPVKYKDPGCPTISCTIGNTVIKQALLDLGASVNLLPYSVYQQLELGELKPTKVTLQLADRSIKTPKREKKFESPSPHLNCVMSSCTQMNTEIKII